MSKVEAMAKQQKPIRISVTGGCLPYAENAWIDPPKLTEYALDPDKSDKAEGFALKLGIYLSDWRYLHDQILERVGDGELTAIRTNTTVKWPEWTVRLPIDGRGGRSCAIATGWMVDARHAPWLTTTYVLPTIRTRKSGSRGASGSRRGRR